MSVFSNQFISKTKKIRGQVGYIYIYIYWLILIIIIVIKKKKEKKNPIHGFNLTQLNPCELGWIGLNCCDGLS